jgi:FkbM family methyltransferase
MSSVAISSLNVRPRLRIKWKDRYWIKTLKWLLYKKRFGSRAWHTRFTFDRLVRKLTSRDLVVDCGANVGEFTRMLARRGATVHAFEPDPYAFSQLQAATAGLPNVVLHNVAVGTSDASVKLFRKYDFENDPRQASISSSLFESKENVDPENSVDIKQIDFTAFLASLGRKVSIMKIDIEGAEVPLLEHLITGDGLENCERVFVETHESRIPELADRTAKLREAAASNQFKGKLYLDWH